MPKLNKIVVEEITFQNTVYRRYPESNRFSDRTYYKSSNHLGNSKYLHRAIWEFYNGDIPQSNHVHHIDGNADNNDISNLECITSEEHNSKHIQERSQNSLTPEHLAHLEKIRPMTKEWHVSEEGHKWHIEHGKQTMAKRQEIAFICLNCKEAFKSIQSRAKFCNDKCKSLYRKIINAAKPEISICAWCKVKFENTKTGRKKKNCSDECTNNYNKDQKYKKYHALK